MARHFVSEFEQQKLGCVHVECNIGLRAFTAKVLTDLLGVGEIVHNRC